MLEGALRVRVMVWGEIERAGSRITDLISGDNVVIYADT